MTTRVVLGVLAAAMLAGCVVGGGEKRYRILSSAMEPTLHCAQPASGCEADEQDIVVTEEVDAKDVRRGDIVVFEIPPAARVRCGSGGTFVKRVIGLPGERVELRYQGDSEYVYIDGKKLDEPYIEPNRRYRSTMAARKLPDGQYFLLGDNRSQSCDSREWGTVPAFNIHHRVIAIERSSGRIELR